MSPSTYRVVVGSGRTDRGQPFVRLQIGAPGRFNDYEIPLGAAFALGAEIVATVEALLQGEPRPWDNDPGRTPFASRSFGRGGQRSAGAAAAT